MFICFVGFGLFWFRKGEQMAQSAMGISWTVSKAMFWKPFYLPSGSSLLTCKFCRGPNNINGQSQPLYHLCKRALWSATD